MKIILASKSGVRKDILDKHKINSEVIPSNIDEDQVKILQSSLELINNDQDLTSLKSEFSKKQLNLSGLLSLKPKIFVCNVDEKSLQNGNDYTKSFIEKFGIKNTLIVSADISVQ